MLVAALAAVASGCAGGDDERAASEPRPTEREPTTEAAPVPPAPELVQARVHVIDGDTARGVKRATVRLGRQTRRADRKGAVAFSLTPRAYVRVEAKAPGYLSKRTRVPFRPGRILVRLYRPELQWPLYGATPARTQAHPAIKLRPPFRIVWGRNLRSLIEFPAVVWEGIAYVGNFRGYLYALSMRNGRVHWRTRIGTRMAASPAIDVERDQLLMVTMIPGEAVAVDLRTGRVKWRYRVGARIEPSPVIRGDVAYFGATNGNVYALDLARRRARWVQGGAAKITSSPALVGGRLYFGDYAGRVFALNARTGRRVWTGSAGSRVYGTVAVAGGRVFAPSVFSGLSALSARTGALLWRIPVSDYLYSSPAYYRGRVFFGTYADTVSAVDAASGRIVWTRDAGGSVSGAIQVVAGVVYAASFGARTTAWDWRTGRELWRFPHGEYVPLSGNGGRLLMHGHTHVWAVAPVRRR